MKLLVKTDQPMAYVAILGKEGLTEHLWQADRKLAKELLGEIEGLVAQQAGGWKQIDGIIVFGGPGSFTGLRIGAAVSNAIAYARHIPIVSAIGEDWRDTGAELLDTGMDQKIVLPHYGADPHITLPKK